MEEQLNDKSRLTNEWEELSKYIAEPNSTEIAKQQINSSKNRYDNALPCK